MLPCLILSIIRWGSRVKWNNLGKGGCSSKWKRSLRVTLDYGQQLYLYFVIWVMVKRESFVCNYFGFWKQLSLTVIWGEAKEITSPNILPFFLLVVLVSYAFKFFWVYQTNNFSTASFFRLFSNYWFSFIYPQNLKMFLKLNFVFFNSILLIPITKESDGVSFNSWIFNLV